jgi:hypothetical protein
VSVVVQATECVIKKMLQSRHGVNNALEAISKQRTETRTESGQRPKRALVFSGEVC